MVRPHSQQKRCHELQLASFSEDKRGPLTKQEARYQDEDFFVPYEALYDCTHGTSGTGVYDALLAFLELTHQSIL